MIGAEDVAAPTEWVISRVCEAFACVPSMALRELDRDPQLVFDILNLRAYAETKAAIDHAERPEQAPTGPMVDVVFQVTWELIQERRGEQTK